MSNRNRMYTQPQVANGGGFRYGRKDAGGAGNGGAAGAGAGGNPAAGAAGAGGAGGTGAAAGTSTATPTEVTTKELGEAIGGAVTKALAGMPVPPTAEAIAGAVTTAMAKHFPVPAAGAAPVPLSIEAIKAATTDACGALVNGERYQKKKIGGNDGQGREQTEIPVCLSKGNLPLHMAQLFNIVMAGPIASGDAKAIVISPERHADGIKAGDQMLHGVKVIGTKALTPATVTAFIERDLSAELQRRFYLSTQIGQAFAATEILMPSDPFDFPLLKGTGDFYLDTVGGDGSDATPSDPTLGQFTLTTKTFRGMRQVTDNANEDSVIAILPELERDLGDSAARNYESALINGDVTSTHQDSDVTNAKDFRKAWNGFRRLALAGSIKSDISSGGLSRANLTALLKLLKKWGVNKKDLLWIWGSAANATLSNLDEFALAYARGGPTTFGDGALPSAPFGGSYAVSEYAREDLNASGVYDGSTVTKGSVLVLTKGAFRCGYRRQFTVEMARNARAGTWDLIASMRRAFQPMETPSTTLPFVALGYNYTA